MPLRVPTDHQREAEGPRGEAADQACENDQDEVGCEALFLRVAPEVVVARAGERPSSVTWPPSRDWRPTARRRAGQTLPGP